MPPQVRWLLLGVRASLLPVTNAHSLLARRFLSWLHAHTGDPWPLIQTHIAPLTCIHAHAGGLITLSHGTLAQLGSRAQGGVLSLGLFHSDSLEDDIVLHAAAGTVKQVRVCHWDGL